MWPQFLRTLALLRIIAAGVLLLNVAGCGRKPQGTAPATPPPPVYTGPAFLRGTVGSMARLRGYEPMLVSGWGLVVNLNGTGSTSVPQRLRQWYINEMRKEGVGSARLRESGNPLAKMSPAEIIASPNTAPVEIIGLIPPGAPKGTRFDLIVTAIQGTETTSLENGDLLPCDLGLNGSNPQLRFVRKQASARGPVYVSPDQPVALDGDPLTATHRRKAVIVAGGIVSDDRRVELVLNRPSWTHSREISDRINERFPKEPGDRRDTANAVTDLIIEINIPARFREEPERLLALISNLFTQRQPNFEVIKAQQLADVLINSQNAEFAQDIALAWEALGRPAVRALKNLYDHDQELVALTALEAGSRLGDELASDRLGELAGSTDSQVRQRVAKALESLPRSLRGRSTLRKLLNDNDDAVRLAAYESLVNVEALASDDSKTIHRVVMAEYEIVRDPKTGKEWRQMKPESFKFVLDLVPSDRPMVYVAQTDMPRLVIFNPDQEFDSPLFAQLWDNHLMLRWDEPSAPVSVFFQPFGNPKSRTIQIAPTLANLAFLMAHKPTIDNPTEGLDLTFSQVAHAVYELCRSGAVECPVILEDNAMVARVEQLAKNLPALPRAETDDWTDQSAGEQIGVPNAPLPPAEPGFIDLPTARPSEMPQAPTESRPETMP